MLLDLLKHIFVFALHIDNNTVFPKPLSKSEEKECFEKMASGDKQAKNELIEHNLRLVAHIVKKYSSNPSDQDELISVGTIGLIKAVTSFDHTKGAKFATFASRCIENEILMNFRSARNTLTLLDLIDDGTDIHEQVDNLIRSKLLYSFLDKCLNEREHRIIIYRYGLYGIHPHTQSETAEKLGISRSYVSRIEKKAIEKLRKMYDSTPF